MDGGVRETDEPCPEHTAGDREITVIVPTRNEAPNVEPLLRRLEAVSETVGMRVLFVDDSDDDTPDVIRRAAAGAGIPVGLIHRAEPTGGLGGAVMEGMAEASTRWCLVMDGDLQHPPEAIPSLVMRAQEGDADVVVASRYVRGGRSDGLAGAVRVAVSRASTLVTRAMFPRRLRGCTDPMTGFFLIDRTRVPVAGVRPRGFKILLEILARRQLRVAEVPFEFGVRHGGTSKASLRQGVRFLTQLAALRFGRMSAFAAVGAFGAVANLALMAGMIALGVSYLVAAIIAAEITMISNFVMFECFVYRDLRTESARTLRGRFIRSFTFNNAEAVIRLPVLYALVEWGHISSVPAAALTLMLAFVVRFTYHSLVVYRGDADATAPPAPGDVPEAPRERVESR